MRRHATRLRPDLFEDLAPLRTSGAAVEAERERAIELAACGFVAHSDGISYGEGEGGWAEWDAARLEAVAGHADAAIAELRACAFEPLPADDGARLLRGEAGFWVARYIDQADPPPSYGMFAHVSAAALAARWRG